MTHGLIGNNEDVVWCWRMLALEVGGVLGRAKYVGVDVKGSVSVKVALRVLLTRGSVKVSVSE